MVFPFKEISPISSWGKEDERKEWMPLELIILKDLYEQGIISREIYESACNKIIEKKKNE